jgi:hypothetical protein
MLVKRKILSAPNLFADNKGRIWNNRKGFLRLQKTFVDSNGYQRIHVLDNNNKYKHFYVQRLVCEAFKGEPNLIKPICIRKAPNQQPKRVRANKYLKWGNRDQIKIKTFTSRFSNEIVNLIRQEYYLKILNQSQLAKKYKRSQGDISFIINKKCYKENI